MADIYLLSNSVKDEVKSLPIIDISYLDFDIDLNIYDALIFTSKNSVNAIDKKDVSWKKIPSYAISEQTAKLIEKKGAKLIYTGNSRDGNEFAKELTPLLKGKKALYLRAKELVSNLNSILREDGIDLDEKIVYETLCKKYEDIDLKEGSIFIFTSPSTIKCFFKSFTWDASYKAIAIGQTTASALPKYIKHHISKEKSIQSCIELAQSL